MIPDLNWKFDFNDGQIPVTWVGVRVRHIPIDYDLFKSLDKKNPARRSVVHVLDDWVHQRQQTGIHV